MNVIYRNTFIYTVSSILPQFISFLLLPILTHYLTPEQYGIVGAMQTIQSFIMISISLGLEYAIQRLFFDYMSEFLRKKFLGTISISILLNSFIIFSLFILFKNYINLVYKDISFYPYYYLAAVISFFQITIAIPNQVLLVHKKSKLYFYLSTIQIVLTSGFILVFTVGYKLGAFGFLFGRMVGLGLASIFYLFSLSQYISLKVDWPMLKESLAFSLPMIPILLSAWVTAQFDRVFIANYFSLADVGLFSFGKNIASLVGVFTSGFGMAFRPIFFEMANSPNQEDAKKQLYVINNKFIVMLILGTFLLILFSAEIVKLFFSSKYLNSSLYVPFLALSLLVSGITDTTLGLFIHQSKKLLQNSIFVILTGVFSLFLCYLLIIPFGAYGASFVSFLSAMFLFALVYSYTKRHCYFIKFNWNQILKVLVPLIGVVIGIKFLDNLNIVFVIFLKILISALMLFYFTRTKIISMNFVSSFYFSFLKKTTK